MATELMAPPVPAEPEEKLLTAEEFYAMPNTDGFELVDGRIVPKHGDGNMSGPGGRHGKTVIRIGGRLDAFVTSRKLGDVYTETGFTLSSGDVKRPDVAFLEASRLASGTPEGFPEGAPTLAVEVISPNDRWFEVEDKVRLYFEAGTKIVWLVDPKRRALTVRRPDGAPATYIEGDIVPGGAILPGFELPVKDIFE